MEDIKSKWEDWYGDMMAYHQWNEMDYNGRTLLYVCGTAVIDADGRGFASDLVQVIGCTDGAELSEEERREIAQLLKGQHGIENLSFWSS